MTAGDAINRVEEVIRSSQRVNARDYVALVREAGRANPERLLELGGRTYSFGLQQAFLDGDTGALVQVAHIGATMLDASGFHDQAIACLAQASTMVSHSSEARSELMTTKAWYEVVGGRVSDGERTLEASLDLAATGEGLHIVAENSVVRCLALEFREVEGVEAAIANARAEGRDPLASALAVQLISSHGALGRTAGAAAAAKTLLQHADGIGHRAREIDAEVASIALRSRRSPVEPAERLADEAEQLMNNHALWKLLVAMLRQSVLRGDHAAAELAHGQLATHHDWLNPGYHNAFSGLRAYHSVLFDAEERAELPTPNTPTLVSVDNVLASAEAVAIGGSLSAAADWIAWLEAELPAEVVTSLEWPACRARVEALLHLRMGLYDEAIALFRAGVGCCEDRGDSIEAEIGRAQLAAVSGDDAERVLATARLRNVGIDAAHFTGAAARVAERAALAGEQILTVQEAQVLGRLARGLSYREMEADRGLPPRGASRPIATTYDKLGVRGRVRAIRLAQER